MLTANTNLILTKRQLEIIKLVAAGKTNKEIGRKLCISVRTSEYKINEIRAKFGLKNRTELAIFYIKNLEKFSIKKDTDYQIKIENLYSEGYKKSSEIASKLGCSRGYTYAVVRKKIKRDNVPTSAIACGYEHLNTNAT